MGVIGLMDEFFSLHHRLCLVLDFRRPCTVAKGRSGYMRGSYCARKGIVQGKSCDNTCVKAELPLSCPPPPSVTMLSLPTALQFIPVSCGARAAGVCRITRARVCGPCGVSWFVFFTVLHSCTRREREKRSFNHWCSARSSHLVVVGLISLDDPTTRK